MSAHSREERLRADLEALRALKKNSSIFDFEFTSEPPDRYTLTFRGRGVERDAANDADVSFVDEHRCDLRLPYSYPERPPDIRWVTPLFHPNVSFSGFINVTDIGLPWDAGISLDVVCERLWDVARFAHLDLDRATNYSAKNWFEEESTLRLPIDHRLIRDQDVPATTNIVKYERRGGTPNLAIPETAHDDILFIGEDTPTPALPQRRAAPPDLGDDDEVLYID